MNNSLPPQSSLSSSIVVEGQKKRRKKGEEEENKVKIKELLERVRKLEEIIQHLVIWARDNFGFSGGGGGGEGIQTFLSKEHIPSGGGGGGGGEGIDDKSKGEVVVVRKNVTNETFKEAHLCPGGGEGGQDLAEGYSGGHGQNLEGYDGNVDGGNDILAPDGIIKVEPLEFAEFVEGDSLIVGCSELYHPRIGQVATNNSNNNEGNHDSDSDYNPNNEENYEKSDTESEMDIKIKSKSSKPKCIRTTIILSKDMAEPLLPNPYIRLGPRLIQLNKSNIKLRTRRTVPPHPPQPPPPPPPAKKKPCTSSPKKNYRCSARFKCDYEECKYFTNFKRKYLEHYRKHTGERPILCSRCGKRFRGQTYLQSHMKSHANDGKFPCQVCKEEFNSERALKKHFKHNHTDLRRQCEICRAVFSNKDILLIHKKNAHDDTIKKIVCELCGQGFKFLGGYNQHMRRHENPNYIPRGPPLVKPTPINPPLDGELDVDKVYQVAPKFICREAGCGGGRERKFITEHMLQTHIRKHHLTPEQRKVACDICYRVFKDLDRMKLHKKTVHITERRFVCSICGQAFKSRMHLIRHEKGHSNPNWKPRANCKPKEYQKKPNNVEKMEEDEGPTRSMESTTNSSTSSNLGGDL